MFVITLFFLALLSAGTSFQEGPSSEEEWEWLLEALMIQMEEENDWESFSEEMFGENSPESTREDSFGREELSGEEQLRLLLDENTDMATRLIMLEDLRQSEDSSALEEVLRAFASQEKDSPLPRKQIKSDLPQVKIKTVSRKVRISTEEAVPEKEEQKSLAQWVNILIGGLALTLAGVFIFRRGHVR